jgi:thiol:disulfide interchange protein DsbA
MLNRTRPFAYGLRHWGIALGLGVLAACGSPPSSGTATTPTPPAPAATQPDAPPAPAAEAAPATAPVPAVQETAAADGGTGGEQLKLASAATPAAEGNWRFKEGTDFKVLTTAQGTTGAPGKIEVTEAFWYGCPHCYEFDPMLQDWVRRLPADVAFVRLPVMWNPTNQIHARVFYTAQALGKLDQMHSAIFREIHVEKRQLTSEDEIQAFFGKFGVSADEFQKTFRSFAVESQLKRAKDLTERYQVRSVPLLIVDGKYSTDGPGIKSREDVLMVTTELIERERRR